MNKVSLLFGALLVSAGAANAAELYTPPLAPTSLDADNFSECVATNVGSAATTVLIQGFDSEGTLAATTTMLIEPGKTRGISLGEIPGPTGPVVYCKFSFRGNANSIRAAIHVLDSGGDGIIAALAAS